MNISLTNGFSITDIVAEDKSSYLTHLVEKQIHDQTLNIPYPYTEADADWWLNHVVKQTEGQGRSLNWAIRTSQGELIGGIGFTGFDVGKSHKGELGYWLAKSWWGKGIMTEAVSKVSDYAFSELGLIRITAHIFHFNKGSARVLEKVGFKLEGHLRKHYFKNGKIFDGLLYAKISSEMV